MFSSSPQSGMFIIGGAVEGSGSEYNLTIDDEALTIDLETLTVDAV